MKENDYRLNREVTSWIDRISRSWEKIAITDVQIPDLGATVYVGQKIPVTMNVHLGDITPDDIRVEIVAGRINSQDKLLSFMPVSAGIQPLADNATQNGTFTYSGEVECQESGRFGITARVIPKNEHLIHTRRPKLISWW